MDLNTAKTNVEARLGRCLTQFEASDRTQVAAHPDEVKALLAHHCPPELESLRDVLSEKGTPPQHVLLTVAQAQQLLAETERGKKEKGDAKQTG